MISSQLKHKKLSAKPRACAVDIVVDDDSLSSLGTSSTMGYRDSFGDNDDGCFHLLERSVGCDDVTRYGDNIVILMSYFYMGLFGHQLQDFRILTWSYTLMH